MYNKDDILRVEISGVDMIVHYVRGDEKYVTLTSDPYNERRERMYKISDVIVKGCWPAEGAVSLEL